MSKLQPQLSKQVTNRIELWFWAYILSGDDSVKIGYDRGPNELFLNGAVRFARKALGETELGPSLQACYRRAARQYRQCWPNARIAPNPFQ